MNNPRSVHAPMVHSVYCHPQRCAPSVVNITSMQNARLDRFSLDITQVPAGTGSGFVWDREGHIVTNFHVSRVAKTPPPFLSELPPTLKAILRHACTYSGDPESKRMQRDLFRQLDMPGTTPPTCRCLSTSRLRVARP